MVNPLSRAGDAAPASGLYLSAEQAAQALGITIATLYVYVSRKLVRSEAIAGTRLRRYLQADVERLKRSRSATMAAPGEEALGSQTRITLLSGTEIYYRGQDAVALSRHASFEDVVALLWQADGATLFDRSMPDAAASPAPLLEHLLAPMLACTRGWPAIDRAVALFPLIERADRLPCDLSHAAYTRAGVQVLRWFAALVTGLERPEPGAMHRLLARHLHAPPRFDDVIRSLLVLCADHEIEPTTHAVRTVAAAGATPWTATLTGLLATQRQRQQADGELSRFLMEVVTASHGSLPVASRLGTGAALPGFGDKVHVNDPRTRALMAALQAWDERDVQVMRLREALEFAARHTDATPRLVLPAMLIGKKLRLTGQELAIAALGRMAGWLAHAFEQQEMSGAGQGVARPRATYIGSLP